MDDVEGGGDVVIYTHFNNGVLYSAVPICVRMSDGLTKTSLSSASDQGA